MKIAIGTMAVLWGVLNFVIYFDAGFDRALMVSVHFGVAAYCVLWKCWPLPTESRKPHSSVTV